MMKRRPLSELSDQELLQEEKEVNSFSVINAVFIGFLAGILAVGIFSKATFLVMLIPLFLIRLFVKDPRNKRAKELKLLLEEKNLR